MRFSRSIRPPARGSRGGGPSVLFERSLFRKRRPGLPGIAVGYSRGSPCGDGAVRRPSDRSSRYFSAMQRAGRRRLQHARDPHRHTPTEALRKCLDQVSELFLQDGSALARLVRERVEEESLSAKAAGRHSIPRERRGGLAANGKANSPRLPGISGGVEPRDGAPQGQAPQGREGARVFEPLVGRLLRERSAPSGAESSCDRQYRRRRRHNHLR